MKTWVAALAALAVVLLVACSTNEAKSYLPKASELCCHGNWQVSDALVDEGKAEGNCSDIDERFQSAESCWYRFYFNNRVRPGEPRDLYVWVAVMETEADISKWLPGYEPHMSGMDYEALPFAPLVGEDARTWSIREDGVAIVARLRGSVAAFKRDNLAVVVYAMEGSTDERNAMFESVDEALLDRIIGYRSVD